MTWSSVVTNPMTTLGDMIYEDNTPTPARLAGNTTSTKKFLTQTGTGSVSAAPGWNTIAAGDLPTITLTGDVTGAASGGSVATSIAATSNSTLTTLSGLTTASSLATVGTISSGTWAGTAVTVNHGGTGVTSTTAYAPIVGGTSSTGALQSASTGLATSGLPLVSNGSSSVPSFQVLPTSGGGTGQSSNWTQDGVVYASSTTVPASTAAGTVRQYIW